MVGFQNPAALALIVPVLVVVALVVRHDFVKSKRLDASALRARLRLRFVVLFLRSLVFVLLLVAVASPFSLRSFVKSGSPSLTVYVDNSSSMEVLDTSGVPALIKELEARIPVRVRSLGSGSRSAIGDSLLAGVEGDDNVLVITDGRNNGGRSLGDMLVLAASLNSTVSAVSLEPSHYDSSVAVIGPRVVTNADESVFDVVVNQVGGMRGYRLVVYVDDEEVHSDAYSGSAVVSVSRQFAEGYHVIRVEIDTDDFFSENNVFYKVVKVEPKPKVLLVSKSPTPLSNIFNSLYDAASVSSLPSSLESFSAVVFNDISAKDIDADALSRYVIDGNGLVVFGGRNSYDMGGYKGSVFEGMLPVIVGRPKEQVQKDVSIVLLIDISGSTGSGFGRGVSASVEEVEKALAVGVIDSLRKTDKVAVVAFNTEAYLVSDLVKVLGNEDYLKGRISRLDFRDGTLIGEGIVAARRILAPLEGSRYIILLSDGKSAYKGDDLRASEIASNLGIKLFTIGVGESTNREHMQALANAGNGYYFEPKELERLSIVFGSAEDGVSAGVSDFPLEVLNGHHFITSGVRLSGSISGYNQVVPKPSADLLVSTARNSPVLSVSRLGLGRIAAFSTDDGSSWAPQLFGRDNSVLVTRAVNWAVGDLGRKKDFDVDAKDIFLGDEMAVNVVSGSLPVAEGLKFAKVGKRLYSASFTPDGTGLQHFLGVVAAVNYEFEYASLGVSAELERQVSVTGGRMFGVDDVGAIVDKVRADSRRVVTEPVSYSWVFLLLALLVFLGDVAFRRLKEGRIK